MIRIVTQQEASEASLKSKKLVVRRWPEQSEPGGGGVWGDIPQESSISIPASEASLNKEVSHRMATMAPAGRRAWGVW
jgi:hypothetical protein